MTGWNFPPSFYWPTGALHLSTYPFLYSFSPWQNHSLPILPRTYASHLNTPHQGKTNHPDGSKPEESSPQFGCTPQSYNTTFEDKPESNWSVPSTYHHYGKSSTPVPPSYPFPSTFIHPMRASTIDPPDAPSVSSVTPPQSDKALATISTSKSSAHAKLASQENQTSQSWASFPSPSTFFSSMVKSTDHPGVLSSIISKAASCAPANIKLTSYSSPAKTIATSTTPTLQSACPCGVCQSSDAVSTWSGFASYPSSACSAGNMLQSPYLATINPTISSLATPSIPPSLPKLNNEVESSVAPAAGTSGEAHRAAQENWEEAQLREEKLEVEEEELEVLDVTTVTQSKEEDVTSTSDETK